MNDFYFKFVLLLLGTLALSMLLVWHQNGLPCSAFANTAVKDVPVRCAAELDL